MKNPLKIGTIIYCDLASGIKAGVVLKIDENAKKLGSLTISGNIEEWSFKKLLYISNKIIQTRPEKETLNSLQNFEKKVSALKEEIDLKTLWELVKDDKKKIFSESELADIVFGIQNPQPEHFSSLYLKISEDKVFFKESNAFYIPNPEKAVQAMITERNKKIHDENLLKNAVQEIHNLVSGKISKSELSDAGKHGIKLLEDMAVFGIDSSSHNKAVELIEKISPMYGGDRGLFSFDILVRGGIFKEDENLLLKKYGIKKSFHENVLEEAKRISEHIENNDSNISSLKPFTIDDEETKDIDDALAVEDIGDGKKRIHIIISDVAGFIHPESIIGQEAIHRGSSIYLPDEKISMFPPCLSEEILSLFKGKKRKVIDFSFIFNEETSSPVDFSISLKTINSEQRLTYEETDAIMSANGDKNAQDWLCSALSYLSRIANAYRKQRERMGALIIKRGEVKVRVRENGEIDIKKINPHSPSRNLIAELMIMTCAITAQFLRNYGIPAVYRKQAPPSDLSSIKGIDPESPLFAYQLVRLMSKSELTTIPAPHHGLGVLGYAQVTSPIRRCQDYLTHIQIRNFIAEGSPMFNTQELMEYFCDLEQREEIHSKIERDRKKYFILKHLSGRIGEEIEVIVLAEQQKRYIVELKDYAMDISLNLPRKILPGTETTFKVIDVNPRREIVVLK